MNIIEKLVSSTSCDIEHTHFSLFPKKHRQILGNNNLLILPFFFLIVSSFVNSTRSNYLVLGRSCLRVPICWGSMFFQQEQIHPYSLHDPSISSALLGYFQLCLDFPDDFGA